jgi:cytochrome c
VLASELTEPMELDMLPDGKIIFIERRGNIKLYNPNTGLVTIAHKLPVYSEQEDGLLGMALDPGYEQNHWIYLYCSPIGDESVNNSSRFVFQGDTLDRASEKLILQVAVQREECCHAGGCVEFDAEGNLYLSTGDNTNPFASDGYSPSDERSGRSAGMPRSPPPTPTTCAARFCASNPSPMAAISVRREIFSPGRRCASPMAP